MALTRMKALGSRVRQQKLRSRWATWSEHKQDPWREAGGYPGYDLQYRTSFVFDLGRHGRTLNITCDCGGAVEVLERLLPTDAPDAIFVNGRGMLGLWMPLGYAAYVRHFIQRWQAYVRARGRSSGGREPALLLLSVQPMFEWRMAPQSWQPWYCNSNYGLSREYAHAEMAVSEALGVQLVDWFSSLEAWPAERLLNDPVHVPFDSAPGVQSRAVTQGHKVSLALGALAATLRAGRTRSTAVST